MEITHSDLVTIGSNWLKRHKQNIIVPNCSFVLSEQMSNTPYGEIPDIYGLCSWASILIEVKVSRNDFIADSKKRFRIDPEKGIGEFRYFLCPMGLIELHELPKNWGMLYLCGKNRIQIAHRATKQPSCLESERSLLFTHINKLKK